MGLSLKKIIGEITGAGARKRREKDVGKGLGEIQQEIGVSANYLQGVLKNLLEESGIKLGGLEKERFGRQQQLAKLIEELGARETSQRGGLLEQLEGGIESAFGKYGGGAESLQDKLRQAIMDSLGETKIGLEDVLGRKESGGKKHLNKAPSCGYSSQIH